MKPIFFYFSAIVFFASCSNGGKKILLMSKGKATVDKEAKTITVESGTSHEEQTIDISDAGNLTMQVTTPAGKNSVEITGNGYYVLNAKTDTIIGAYQSYGAPPTETRTITQEDLKHRIDSVQQLLNGNASAANKTFYILPGKAAKITDNLDATLVGPFNSLTSLEQTDNTKPEVYKFYTTKDVRETLGRLQKMTVAPPSPNQ